MEHPVDFRAEHPEARHQAVSLVEHPVDFPEGREDFLVAPEDFLVDLEEVLTRQKSVSLVAAGNLFLSPRLPHHA